MGVCITISDNTVPFVRDLRFLATLIIVRLEIKIVTCAPSNSGLVGLAYSWQLAAVVAWADSNSFFRGLHRKEASRWWPPPSTPSVTFVNRCSWW